MKCFPQNITEHFMDYVKNCHQKSFFILEIYMERIIWDWEWSLVTVSQLLYLKPNIAKIQSKFNILVNILLTKEFDNPYLIIEWEGVLQDLGASGAGSKVLVLIIGVLVVNPELDSICAQPLFSRNRLKYFHRGMLKPNENQTTYEFL